MRYSARVLILMTFGDKLDLLIAKGPALREAGYLSVEIDGCSAQLSPKDSGSEIPADLKALLDDAKGEKSADPLGEASTYGLPDGSELPGFDLSRLVDRARNERT